MYCQEKQFPGTRDRYALEQDPESFLARVLRKEECMKMRVARIRQRWFSRVPSTDPDFKPLVSLIERVEKFVPVTMDPQVELKRYQALLREIWLGDAKASPSASVPLAGPPKAKKLKAGRVQ